MADGHGSKCKCCTLDCIYPATREPFLPLSRLIPQTFAEKEAVHCKGGCSALRGRLQCTASETGKTDTEIAIPILDKRTGRRDASVSPMKFLPSPDFRR